jgi:hypothetical protein
MNWLKSFLEESPGVGSMMRLIHWWAFVFTIILPLVVWALLCWHAKAMLPIDGTISTFCLVGFGSATGGKVIQSFGEKPSL